MIGVTVFLTFSAEFGLVRAGEEVSDCLLGVLWPGGGVGGLLFKVFRRLGDVDVPDIIFLF